MWDELRDRLAHLLIGSTTCMLCATGADHPGGVVAHYQSRKLEIECLIPRWSDVAFYVEQQPQVLVLIQLKEGQWLHYQGFARLIPGTPDEQYARICVTPRRIDLIDEAPDWRVRETLELE